MIREDYISLKVFHSLHKLTLVVNIQTNHMCHITSTQLKDYFLTYKVFSSLSPCLLFVRGGEWRKPPRKVSYKRTFGKPDQGQMQDVWESQTTESALRWQMRHIAPRHILEVILEVILEYELGIKSMTWIFNPGSRSKSSSLPRN